MAWLIAYFPSDQSVSMVSEKWPKKNGKKSYFPKTKVTKNIKKEAEVDRKSGNWGLYSCRILMNGAKFDTYEEARNAEAIAQNHSTMTSFEASYTEKQKSRKHPNVFDTESSDDDKCTDSKNIAELTKLDSQLYATAAEKQYAYVREAGEGVSSNDADEYDNNNESECANDDVDDDQAGTDENESSNGNDDDESECENDVNDDDQDGTDEIESNDDDDVENESVGNSENDASFTELDPAAFQCQANNNLESTSELRSPAEEYDFSDDRGLLRVEKLLMHVCRELEAIKTDMKALKIKSNDTEMVIEKLVTVCKDLSVEVFSCTEEFKKRNGMFTDMLVPNLKLPVTRRKHYKNNETELENNKIADNMIKYLASTINESTERPFIESCFNVIFDIEFLANKVWWKNEPGKVLIKHSQILHCIKESVKMKFGLTEPRKTDKQIERLIYKSCRNLKDKYRKSLKKNQSENDKLFDKPNQCGDEVDVDETDGGADGQNEVPTIPKRAKKRLATTEGESFEAAKKTKKTKSKF